MSSYDKVVKLACKPKAAPPKAKYLDTIIAATWSEDGAVHDVCKALSPRFREPNVIVVFKALIVLHTMIRNGATDNVLSYLSSSDVLRLRNVSSGNWEGYSTPQNLQNYAIYLDSRIRAYRDLKHDAIRVQAESNRDMRNSQSIEDETLRTKKGSAPPPSRSKTIMGRKLRVMTVEKGLLRETKAVHRMIDALLECRFYVDDLEDDLIITALRMLVKDLLILFQAGNEGVINVLEHYFEMSHIDAKEALAIYRHFCKQTERVVEYLGVARKLQNLLNVPIPNLKHAPVSLAGALQEYLDDPNFEQNRLEYRANKQAVDKGGKDSTLKPPADSKVPQPSSSSISPKPEASASSSDKAATSKDLKSADGQPSVVVDFFSSIEEQQPNMFNPQTNSPNNAYFQQQATVNPFVQRQMVTGQPFSIQPSPSLQIQSTGFQQTFSANPSNPFGIVTSHSLQPQPTATPIGHRPFSSYIQPQATAFLPNQVTAAPAFPNMLQPQQTAVPFLQPQATGSNPFRQSMIAPQTTGMALFGNFNQQPPLPNLPSFGSGAGTSRSATQPNFPLIASASTPFAQPTPSSTTSTATSNGISVPTRPASTPLTAFGSSTSASSTTSLPVVQPVKTHQTGTKNPFGPIVTPPPPVPKQPTLMELALGQTGVGVNTNGTFPTEQQQQQQQQPMQTGGVGKSLFGFNSSALSPGATDMSSIASSFSFNKSPSSTNGNAGSGTTSSLQGLSMQDTSTTASTSTFSSSSLLTQPTGTTATSNATSFSSTPLPASSSLKPQITGFSGLKPFKPTSSFGASLLESLPPIPGSGPNTPAVTGVGAKASPGVGGSILSTSTSSSATTTTGLPGQQTGLGALNGQSSSFGALNGQPTGALNSSASPLSSSTGNFGSGSSLGQGLRPQMTGGGAANPFRASMMAVGSSSNIPPVPPLPNGMGASLFGNASSMGSSGTFGASAFGQNTYNPSATPAFNTGQHQHQQQNASLI